MYMKLFQKKMKKYPYDPALQKPVIYSSICTGEKRAGFLWNKDGRFEEVACIRSSRDMEMFLKDYGLKKEDVEIKY